MVWTFAILFVLVCVLMMLVILIQKPRGGGLSGAFGGSGGGGMQNAFGAKVGDVLTWFTVVCFTIFLLLAMGLTWATKPDRTRLSPLIPNATTRPATDAPSTDMAPPIEIPTPETPAPTTQPVG